MSEQKTKKKSLVNESIVLKGKVKFSNLLIPKSFDPTTKKSIEDRENGAYDLTLLIPEGDSQLDQLDVLYKDAVAFEQDGKTRAELAKQEVKKSPVGIDTDKEGTETGFAAIRLKRKAKNGAPVVVGEDGVAVEGLEFIQQGSDVLVQVRTASYTVAGNVGLSIRFEAVRIVKKAEGGGGGGSSIKVSDELLSRVEEEGIF